MEQLAKAVLAVMNEVKGIEKSMTVGTGSYAYQGVPDKEVKKIIGESMHKHGLCILPIGIEPQTKIETWTDEYGKQKQSVFTEVKTKYLLLHESGESVELQGYGHGTDTQDKGAGKATTYALKYTLLYSFLTPTGKIDDTDGTHSEEIPTPPAKKEDIRKWLNKFTSKAQTDLTKDWVNTCEKLRTGSITLDKVKEFYRLNKELEKELLDISNLKA